MRMDPRAEMIEIDISVTPSRDQTEPGAAAAAAVELRAAA